MHLRHSKNWFKIERKELVRLGLDKLRGCFPKEELTSCSPRGSAGSPGGDGRRAGGREAAAGGCWALGGFFPCALPRARAAEREESGLGVPPLCAPGGSGWRLRRARGVGRRGARGMPGASPPGGSGLAAPPAPGAARDRGLRSGPCKS